MANVLSFPVADVARWVSMERELKEFLAAHGYEAGAIAYACEEARRVYERVESFDMKLSSEIAEICSSALWEMRGQFAQRMGAIFASLACAHADRYRALAGVRRVYRVDARAAKGDRVLELIVFAESGQAARVHAQTRYTGWEIGDAMELPEQPAHFVIAVQTDLPD